MKRARLIADASVASRRRSVMSSERDPPEEAVGPPRGVSGWFHRPSSWDGYAATVVTNAGLTALESGGRTEVSLRHEPNLYKAAASGGGGVTGTD
jgi:hypothetical protein